MNDTRPHVIDHTLVLSVLEHWLGDYHQIEFIRQFGTAELDKMGGNATRGFSFALEHVLKLALVVASNPLGDIGEDLRAIVREARAEVRESVQEHECMAARRAEREALAIAGDAVSHAEIIVGEAREVTERAETVHKALLADRKAPAARKARVRK